MFKKLFRINILVSVMALSFSVKGQMKMQGYVKDFTNKSAIDSAFILIRSTNPPIYFQSKSDKQGFYSFSFPATIHEGQYQITINKAGYFNMEGIVLITQNAKRDFFMKSRTVSALPASEPVSTDSLLNEKAPPIKE